MKNRFKKFLILSAAVVLLAGTVSDVAYAHSNHHKSRKTTAACYAACYQDGSVCNGSHYTEYHTGTWSGHHSERGHWSHH